MPPQTSIPSAAAANTSPRQWLESESGAFKSPLLADTGMGSSRQSAPSSASAALWQGLAPSGSSARSSAQVRTLCPSASSSPASRACLPSPPHKAKIIKVHAPFSIYSMQLPLAGAAGMVYTYFI